MNKIIFHIRCPECKKQSAIKFAVPEGKHPTVFLYENSTNLLTCPHCKHRDELQKFPSPFEVEVTAK